MSPWKLGLGAVATLFLTVALLRSCGVTEPIVIPDWGDSLRAVRQVYQRERDSLRHVVDANKMVADSAKRAAESWRRRALIRPTRPAPNPGTIVPDSGSPDTNPDNVSGNPDIYPDTMSGYRAQIDSLWAALDASDSAYASLEAAYFAEQRRSAAALAGWAAADSALTQQGLVAERAINSLTVALNKAQRGCRVLGLLPCPELALTGGVTTLGGAVGMGATLGVSIPIKLGGS